MEQAISAAAAVTVASTLITSDSFSSSDDADSDTRYSLGDEDHQSDRASQDSWDSLPENQDQVTLRPTAGAASTSHSASPLLAPFTPDIDAQTSPSFSSPLLSPSQRTSSPRAWHDSPTTSGNQDSLWDFLGKSTVAVTTSAKQIVC